MSDPDTLSPNCQISPQRARYFSQNAIISSGSKSNRSPATTVFRCGSNSMSFPKLSTVPARHRDFLASRSTRHGGITHQKCCITELTSSDAITCDKLVA